MAKLIESLQGYDNQIGILVSQMILVRKETENLTQNLSQKELDFNLDDKSNSIGTLLLHIAALEFDFQLKYFFGRPFSENELKKYEAALPGNMLHRKIKGNSIEHYLEELSIVRKQTLYELSKKKDEWLYRKIVAGKNVYDMNIFYLLRHLADDELNHQGQIRWIRRRLEC